MKSLLELRHLKTLSVLREAGSLSRAATLLNLTQSALSHQVKLLEELYGAALFERKSVPIRFTTAGLRLLELAGKVLPEVEHAERDVLRLAQGTAGQLRIAVECHTCFDWLMPVMDRFRPQWPEVELDILSGFHADPVGLIHQDRADIAIVSEHDETEDLDFHPLFRYEIVALMPADHRLAEKDHLTARDFARETLITYPIPDDMLDIVRQVLRPAGIDPPRRTTELTVTILQLIASRRGIGVLPVWAVKPYLDRGYVQARRVGKKGLFGELYLSCRKSLSQKPYLAEFVELTRECCYLNLPEVTLL